MKNFFNKNLAFTLIELLVSVSIILMLIVAAMPNFNKMQSRNRLRSSGEIIQNCIAKAKSLALAPEVDAADVNSYSAILYSKSDPTNPDKCIIYRNTDAGATVIKTIKLSSNIRISPFMVNGVASTQFTYTFENKNHGLATHELDSNNEMNDFSVEDEKLNCLQLKFFYETGEILVEKFGTMNLSNQCIRS